VILATTSPRLSLQTTGSLSGSLILALTVVLILLLLAAVLLRRWQSRRALVRRLDELTRLGEAGQALAGAELDTARLAELVCQQVGQIVDASMF